MQANHRNHQDKDAAEKSPYVETVISVDRVARVVKGGRRFRFRALVTVGDMKGQVGVGLGKGTDVTSAVAKASDVAKKSFVKVPIVNGTLPHETTAKVSSAKILIKPAAPGTGIIAGGVVRVVLESAGVKNVLSKSLGSSNKPNVAYATIEALRTLVPSNQWVTAKKSVNTKAKQKVAEVK